ncbi:MAG: hypothetical protein D6695_08450, partial [Planctomycetota bacterium]
MKKGKLLGTTIASLAATAFAGDGSGLERDLLTDASIRTSLAAEGTGGHDGKFFIASPDQAFRLNIGGQLQLRYNAN